MASIRGGDTPHQQTKPRGLAFVGRRPRRGLSPPLQEMCGQLRHAMQLLAEGFNHSRSLPQETDRELSDCYRSLTVPWSQSQELDGSPQL